MEDLDIFSVMPQQANIFSVYLNTGTLLDLLCGTIEQNEHHLLVNGGISNICGIGGRSQTYKSSIIDAFIARAMSIYPDIKTIVFDSENSKPGTARYDDLSIDNINVSNRIRLFDTTTDDLNSFHEKIKAIVEFKKKHLQDLMVETPFLDEHTHKRIRIPQPTIVEIDSFTVAGVNSETEALLQNNLDESALNTLWMKSGKNKTLFMRQIVQYARAVNIYFVLSAHVGENKDLSGSFNVHPQKQLQYMGVSDKLKNVGSQFVFLTNTFLQTKNVTTVTTQDGKECYYPNDIYPNTVELNRVNITVVRNKINASGIIIPFIISQYEGLMNILTHVQYLKDRKEEKLLAQKGARMTCSLYPNVSFTRKSIRKQAQDDKRLERAVELAAQFIFVKNVYTTDKVDLSTPVETFVDRLLGLDTDMINDILDSRGYWTYSKNDQPYYTIFDIIDIINKIPSSKVVDMSPSTNTVDTAKETTETSSTKKISGKATATHKASRKSA